jgi:hypothetical protein
LRAESPNGVRAVLHAELLLHASAADVLPVPHLRAIVRVRPNRIVFDVWNVVLDVRRIVLHVRHGQYGHE